MTLQEIINNWSEDYTPEIEQKIIQTVKEAKLPNLTGTIADILALSIIDGYNNLAKIILEKEYSNKKVDINELNNFLKNKSEEKESFLHYCAQFGNKEMLIYFLKNKVEISYDKNHMTPLHFLCFATQLEQNDFLEIIDALQQHSPGIINQKDFFNLTPLHYAAYHKNNELMKALLKRNALKTNDQTSS